MCEKDVYLSLQGYPRGFKCKELVGKTIRSFCYGKGKSGVKLAIACLLTVLVSFFCNGASSGIDQLGRAPNNRGLLIFLDDEEGKGSASEEFGPITEEFCTALIQQAGPIIVSGSLIAKLQSVQPCTINMPVFMEQLRAINLALKESRSAKIEKETESAIQTLELKRQQSYLQACHLSKEALERAWIIKEICPRLYLLLPESYVHAQGLLREQVEFYMPDGPTTPAEYSLGLQVNHLETVKISDIQTVLPLPEITTYFTKHLTNIFVGKAAYKASHRQEPCWSLYISGHGRADVVASLPLEKFKQFLDFLKKKLLVKLVYYSSCYGAGILNEQLYKQEGDYPFPIITQALSDGLVALTSGKVVVEADTVQFKPGPDFLKFFQEMTQAGMVNYTHLISCLEPNPSLNSCAQIKFPHTPWFSVIERDRVVPIGSVFASTWKGPLDVAAFLRKRKGVADPLGVLLYTSVIPFELRLSKKDRNWPGVVSMIPGTASHYIERISSHSLTIDELLQSFSQIGLREDIQKTFFIQKIECLPTSQLQDLLGVLDLSHNGSVVLDSLLLVLKKEKCFAYFSYNGVVYAIKNGMVRFAEEQFRKKHSDEVKKALKIFPACCESQLRVQDSQREEYQDVNASADYVAHCHALELEKQMSGVLQSECIVKIINGGRESMSDGTILYLSEPIVLAVHASVGDCWNSALHSLLDATRRHRENKIIWIERVLFCDLAGKILPDIKRDLIVHWTAGTVRVLYTEDSNTVLGKEKVYVTGKRYDLCFERGYVQKYLRQLSPLYIQQKKDERSLFELLNKQGTSDLEEIIWGQAVNTGRVCV